MRIVVWFPTVLPKPVVTYKAIVFHIPFPCSYSLPSLNEKHNSAAR